MSSSTVTVKATPVATATPSATPVAVQAVVSQPSTVTPSLVDQVTHVDPLVFAAIAGTVLIPLLHQLIKKLVSSLHDPKHRLRNYAIAGGLNLLFGFALELQNSGVLGQLHNPALAGLLASGLSFFLGQQVYGFFVKTNEQAKTVEGLPTVETV